MYQILTITPYIVDIDFIHTLRKSYKFHHDAFFEKLPEYCLTEKFFEHDKEGSIRITKYHHQFTGSVEPSNNEYIFMFDASTLEPELQYEIDASGLDELLNENNINFKELFSILSDDGKYHKENAKKKNYCMTRENIYDILTPKEFYALNHPSNLGIPKIVHVVLDLEYFDSDDDIELNVSLIGFLDHDLTLRKL